MMYKQGMEPVLYDFYGYKVLVAGPVSKVMDKEYWRFHVNQPDKLLDNEIDLHIKPSSSIEPTGFPTKPKGSKVGIYLPFKENENTIYYHPRVSLDYIPGFLEMFLNWRDKTFLHAGAVSKNGQAYVFTGTGGVGKTSIVLNLIRRHFDYLSDDWLIVGNGQAYPFPKTIHIFSYNLNDSRLSKEILGSKRYFYKPLFTLLDVLRNISPHRYMSYLAQTLTELLRFNVDVEDLGDNVRVGEVSPISTFFYLERWDGKEILIDDIKAEELARRMAMVNMHERNYFFEEYFKYASKYNVRDRRVEGRFNFDLEILYNVFKAAEICKVMIPRNFNLLSLENLPFPSG